MAELYKHGYHKLRKGHLVRVYEPREGANYMIAFRKDGAYKTECLGHRDPEKAAANAAALVNALLNPKPEPETIEPSKLTLKGLVSRYLESESYKALKPRQQKEKAALIEKIVAYLGPSRTVISLDDDAVKGLLRARKVGTHGFNKGGKQSAYNCFACLRSLILWGTEKRDAQGRRLLRENPLAGTAKRLQIRPNPFPHQPVITHETYEALRKAARERPMYVRVYLVLIEAAGHRLSSVRELAWSDVDLSAGRILWRDETDKEEHEVSRALPPHVVRYLRVWQRHCPSTQWVFPAPRDVSHPVPKGTVDKWMGQVYVSAGMQKPKRTGWHSLRRKWMSERDGYSLAALMEAGAWASPQAALRYFKNDAKRIDEIICQPTRRI